MKLHPVISMVSAIILSAGCAHEERHQAQYENVAPAYSAGRMSDYNSQEKTMIPMNSSGVMVATHPAAPNSAADNSTVSAIREALHSHADIAPIVSNIQISAANGAVVLNGTVQSDELRREIGAVALNTPGVMAVNNQLQILSSPAPGSTPLNPTSTESNGLPRIYHEPDNPMP